MNLRNAPRSEHGVVGCEGSGGFQREPSAWGPSSAARAGPRGHRPVLSARGKRRPAPAITAFAHEGQRDLGCRPLEEMQ